MFERVWQAVRRFLAEQAELNERSVLLNRPWEEEYLHWAEEGGRLRLHGRIPPPSDRRYSVTHGGWCPGLRGGAVAR